MKTRTKKPAPEVVLSRREAERACYRNMVRAVRAWLHAKYPRRVLPGHGSADMDVDVDMVAVLVEEPWGGGATVAAFHADPGLAVTHSCRTSGCSRRRKDCIYCRGDKRLKGGAA